MAVEPTTSRLLGNESISWEASFRAPATRVTDHDVSCEDI